MTTLFNKSVADQNFMQFLVRNISLNYNIGLKKCDVGCPTVYFEDGNEAAFHMQVFENGLWVLLSDQSVSDFKTFTKRRRIDRSGYFSYHDEKSETGVTYRIAFSVFNQFVRYLVNDSNALMAPMRTIAFFEKLIILLANDGFEIPLPLHMWYFSVIKKVLENNKNKHDISSAVFEEFDRLSCVIDTYISEHVECMTPIVGEIGMSDMGWLKLKESSPKKESPKNAPTASVNGDVVMRPEECAIPTANGGDREDTTTIANERTDKDSMQSNNAESHAAIHTDSDTSENDDALASTQSNRIELLDSFEIPLTVRTTICVYRLSGHETKLFIDPLDFLKNVCQIDDDGIKEASKIILESRYKSFCVSGKRLITPFAMNMIFSEVFVYEDINGDAQIISLPMVMRRAFFVLSLIGSLLITLRESNVLIQKVTICGMSLSDIRTLCDKIKKPELMSIAETQIRRISEYEGVAAAEYPLEMCKEKALDKIESSCSTPALREQLELDWHVVYGFWKTYYGVPCKNIRVIPIALPRMIFDFSDELKKEPPIFSIYNDIEKAQISYIGHNRYTQKNI